MDQNDKDAVAAVMLLKAYCTSKNCSEGCIFSTDEECIIDDYPWLIGMKELRERIKNEYE